MNASSPSICLVSASHVSSNPRLIKEADALHHAGYKVHVIAGRSFAPADLLDAQILARAPWTYTIVDHTAGWQGNARRVIRKLARLIIARFPDAPLWIAGRAHHPASFLFAATASKKKADLYIGHTLVGLVAASHAALKNKSRLGFDAEDFHLYETDASTALPEEQNSIRALESRLLPRCVHLTAAAPLIADAYASTYGIRLPVTVENVFPLSETPANLDENATPHDPVRFYWFSQTIGPGRGLEPIIKVLGRLKKTAALSLRGTLASAEYRESLLHLARDSGFSGPVYFLPPAPAAEMARLAAEHDIGLALEPHTPRNRDLCLANKLYTYLLAGLPVLCTPTRAQKIFAERIGDVALLIDIENPDLAAARLDDFLQDTGRYSKARKTAWNLGQTRYNWEFEQPRLLEAVAQALRTNLPGRRSPIKEFGRKTLRSLCKWMLRIRSRPLALSPDGPALILAPHMDDEALGCGALLASRIAAGACTHVAYFTDGSAGLGPQSPVPKSQLVAMRENEARTAMSGLGLDALQIHFLNAPDGRLKHFTAAEQDRWRNVLADLIARVKPAEIILPGRDDGSSEHEALFNLLAATLVTSGSRIRVLEFPVWSWWNPRFLLPAVWRSSRVWHVPVTPHAATKSRLLRSYPSQTTMLPHQGEPALSADFLASFHTSHEFFFESRLPS